MTLDYGSLMDAEEARLAPDTRKGAAPDYGAMMDTEFSLRRQNLAGALAEAARKNPDAYARAVRDGAALGIPPAAAEVDPEQTRERVLMAQADRMLRETPTLAAKFGSPDFARVAHDDTENLGLVESAWRSLQRGWQGLRQAPSVVNIKGTTNTTEQLDEIERRLELGQHIPPADDPANFRLMSQARRDSIRSSLLTSGAESATNVAAREVEKQAVPASGAVSRALGAKDFATFWANFTKAPVEFMASIGPESLVQSAPALALGGVGGAVARGAGAAAGMGAGSLVTDWASSIVEALQEEGVKVNDAAALTAAMQDKALMNRVGAKAAAHAVPVAALDAASLGLASRVIGGRQLVNIPAQAAAQGILGGSGEALGQLASGEELHAGKIMAEVLGEFTTAPVDVVTALGSAYATRSAAAVRAQEHAQVLARMAELAKASALANRDPQSFGEFVQTIAEEGPVNALFVDAKTLVATLEQGGLDASALPESVREQLPEAVVAGGDVSIPVGVFAARIANTDAGRALLPHLKTSAEAMSQAEAQTFMQSQAEQFKAEAEKILGEQAKNETFVAEADAVRQHFAGQLAAVNRFTPAVNDAYSSILRDFYVTMATRLGLAPQEMLARYPLRVAAANVAGERVMDQRSPLAAKEVSVYGGGGANLELHGPRGRVGEAQIAPTQYGDGVAYSIDFVGLDKAHQGAALGLHAVDAVLEAIRERDPSTTHVTAEVMSKNIARLMLRRLGTPEMVSTDIREYPVAEALDLLPDRTPTEADGITPTGSTRVFMAWPMPADVLSQQHSPLTVEAMRQWQAALKHVSPDKLDYAPSFATPTVLRVLGVKEKTLSLPTRVLMAVAEKYPDVPVEVYANLPALLADPLYVYPHKDGGFDVVTDAVTAKGEPIIVGVRDRIRTITPMHDGEGATGLARVHAEMVRAIAAGGKVYARNDEALVKTRASAGAASATIAMHRESRSRPIVVTRDALVKRFGTTFYQPAHIDVSNGALEPDVFDQTKTEAFRRWSNDAPLVTSGAADTYAFKTGAKIVVEAFHGTKRPDRVGVKFLKKRATSGPMAFHTSSPVLASSYAESKQDTSLAYEDQGYENWFKVKVPGYRAPVDIVRAWHSLTPEQKQVVSDLAPRVTYDENGEIVLGPVEHKSGAGSYDYVLGGTKTTWNQRGNPLKALVEDWLNSGNLFNDEEQFLKVLSLAGFPVKDVTFDAPHAAYPFVYKNYIEMQRPLVTGDIPQSVVDALNEAAKRDRSRPAKGGADIWDKNTRTLREWVAAFNEPKNGYVWTSIPDKVTALFASLGYDGIVDWSGKGGGASHPVYVPFGEKQVKSAIGNKGTFGDTNNILRQSLPEGAPRQYTREEVAKATATLKGSEALLAETGGTMPTWLPENLSGPAAEYIRQNGEYEFGSEKQAADYAKGLMLGEGGAWQPVQQPSGRWRAVRQAGALDQQARGQISFGADITQSPTVVTLLKTADLSTFHHEMGHFFLEVLADIASRENAPADVVADFDLALKFMGVESAEKWRAMSLDEKRPFHEKFARGYEAYLFEGLAPTIEQQGMFRRFSAWMKQVYKSLVNLDVKLTPEVRGVYNRLLGSEEQIKLTETVRNYAPLFASEKEAGASPAEWAAYQALHGDATGEAVEQLQKRSLADLKWARNARNVRIKELQREAAEKRKAVHAEVEAEVRAMPVYVAQRFLTHGELPEADRSNAARRVLETAGMQGTKLNSQALRDLYGDGPAAPWRYLPTGKNGMVAAEGGLTPDQAAELLGFTSGDHLVREILAAEPMESVVEGMTDQRMLERYGDLTDESAIQRAADAAVHNELRARVIATELRFLSRAANVREKTPAGGTVNVLARAAKDFAEAIVGRKKLRDIRPNQFALAEARAAKAALAAKNPAEKAVEKRNQLVNFYGERAAREAVEYVEKSLRYLKRFDSPDSRKRIDAEYLDQIDALLERFDLRAASNAEVQRRASLAAWIEAQREAGFEPTIDKALLAEAQRQHYTTLSYEEFRGLVDAVKNVEHLGRLKRKLLTAKDEREFAERVGEASDSIRANATKTVPERRASDRGPLVTIGRLFKGFLAEHRKAASLLREMDGFKDGGVMWELLVRAMNERGNFEASEREKATIALSKLFAPILKDGGLGKKTFLHGKSWTREERIGIALNAGNAVNKERVMTGEKWSPEQFQQVLDTLTPAEADFVQGVWDYISSFKQQIAAKTKRISGVEPEWVEAEPVVVGGKLLAGGYYPIKYDPDRSSKSEADDAAAVQRQMERGLYVRAQTRRGHLEARVESTGRPMRYDMAGVIVSHVDQVIHDLAWHEWLIDANRVLRAAPIDSAVREHYGPDILGQLKTVVRDIAVGELPVQQSWERVLNHLRHGATIVGLGWNVVTSLLQPFGLTQSMVRIGPKWVAKGIASWAGDAVRMESATEAIYAKSEFMRLRGKTMQREVNEIRNQVAGKNSALEASYFWMIGAMQKVADIPTWLGAYEKAMAENDMTEEKAIALADQAVIDAQGGGQTKDLAAIQRGGPALKLWTNFYSFFNTTYNIAVEQGKLRSREGALGVAKLAVDYVLLMVVPAVLGTLLKEALKYGGDDDKELPEKLARDQINYLFGLMVGLRELGAAVQGFQGYGGPAGTRFFGEVANLVKQAGQGEVDEAALKAAANVVGVLFHLPAGQVARTIDGVVAVAQGKTQNPGALLVGFKGN